ncbi:hypothetical protein SAMN02910292_00405 [Lachnospiraceae bacterium XBB2008]|nr:hypothetical protein SAMN02910292_00405 [Lachnospiraceae bacterium XBB2008]
MKKKDRVIKRLSAMLLTFVFALTFIPMADVMEVQAATSGTISFSGATGVTLASDAQSATVTYDHGSLTVSTSDNHAMTLNGAVLSVDNAADNATFRISASANSGYACYYNGNAVNGNLNDLSIIPNQTLNDVSFLGQYSIKLSGATLSGSGSSITATYTNGTITIGGSDMATVGDVIFSTAANFTLTPSPAEGYQCRIDGSVVSGATSVSGNQNNASGRPVNIEFESAQSGGGNTGNYAIAFTVTGNPNCLGAIKVNNTMANRDVNGAFSVSVQEQDNFTIELEAEYACTITSASISGMPCEVDASGHMATATVGKANSYTINITGTIDPNEVNILWTYDPAEQYGAWSEAYIDRNTGSVSLVSIVRGTDTVWSAGMPQDGSPYDGTHGVSINSDGGYVQCYLGDVVTLTFVPAAGYQLSSASLNNRTLVAQAAQSTFSVTMDGLFHLAGAFTAAEPQTSVASSSNVSSLLSSNTNASLTTGTMAVVATGSQPDPSQSSLKSAMGADGGDYLSTVETLDIDMFNIVSKGGAASYTSDSSNYWTTQKTELSTPATLFLGVSSSGLQSGETYSVVMEHDGVLTEIDNAVYNSTSQQLRFSSANYSNYTIIKRKGNPETGSDTAYARATTPVWNFGPVYTGRSYHAAHDYEWRTLKEATEDEDGEYAYVCRTCGDVRYRVPIGAYATFNINTQNKIRNAAKDATVEISTTRWISFHRMVMDALRERPDVTLKVNYLSDGYKGDPMTFTIPAGTDTGALPDENGYAGFKFLGGIFGATARQ